MFVVLLLPPTITRLSLLFISIQPTRNKVNMTRGYFAIIKGIVQYTEPLQPAVSSPTISLCFINIVLELFLSFSIRLFVYLFVFILFLFIWPILSYSPLWDYLKQATKRIYCALINISKRILRKQRNAAKRLNQVIKMVIMPFLGFNYFADIRFSFRTSKWLMSYLPT